MGKKTTTDRIEVVAATNKEDILGNYGNNAGYSHLWRQLFSTIVKGRLQKTSKSRVFILTICVTLHLKFAILY
jgi:hypothetical protein